MNRCNLSRVTERNRVMAFIARTPGAPLGPLVSRLWDCTMAPAAWHLERIMPSPLPTLLINLAEDQTRVYEDAAGGRCATAPGSILSGPYTRSFVIDTCEQTRVMGVEFRAAGAFPLFGERIDLLAERDVGLEDLLGARARHLRERLVNTACPMRRLHVLEQWLIGRLGRHAPHPGVCHAAGLLDRPDPARHIRDVARASGFSERRLGALFREQTGLSPKRYARAMRFRAVLERVHGRNRVDWAGLAADCGFHDQPHLVHEFRSFAGMTPSAYLTRQGPYAAHVPLR